jgi:hypothetical protein
MTHAAHHAKTLGDAFAEISSEGKFSSLLFQKKASEFTLKLWGLNSAEDLLRPTTEGDRSVLKIFKAYMGRNFIKTCWRNEADAYGITLVFQLLLEPTDLLKKPHIFWRVFTGAIMQTVTHFFH